MKRGKIIAMTISLLMAALLMVQPILAWFIHYRTSFLLITGEVQLDVDGWFYMAADDSQPDYLPLSDINEFSFRDATLDNFVAFKFRVTNKTEKDAVLSARFSDFSEYIFENFQEYYNAVLYMGGIDSEFEENLYLLTNTNTAKLATFIDTVYYMDASGQRVDLVQDYYTWQYGFGRKLFSGISLPGVTEDENSGNKIESSVELYFTIRFTQSSASTDEYSKWLCGYTDDDGVYHVGYGQERIANILTYSWSALSAGNRNIANDYLKLFTDCEFRAISAISQEGMSTLRLDIRYFEFIGDNARP